MTGLRLLLVALLLVAGLPADASAAGDEVELVLFWGEGCPHCAAEWEFLGDLRTEYPSLRVTAHEVHDPANRERFATEMAERGLTPVGVPTTIVGEEVWIGFDDTVAAEIRAAVGAELAARAPPETASEERAEVVEVPSVGATEVGSGPLVVSTFLIALVDGVNPCSLWVLSILLALVLRTGSRRRVLLIGGTFLAVTTLLYGLYIAGMYGVLSLLAHQAWVRVAMALVALAFGVIHLKDYFWFRRGPSLTISDRHKPGLYLRMRDVATARHSLPAVLAGTAVLAVGVSVLETPCTAGYPLLWADLLAARGVGLYGALPLFALYMGVFLVDELIVLGVAVIAMRASRLEERGGRLLKLVGGMVMVALAGTLVFAPDLMTSLGGAVGVFGVALALAAGVAAVDRLVSRRRVGSPSTSPLG